MVRSAALAISLSSEVKSIGAYAGFAAIIGLALLTLLYFAAARELRRLREIVEQAGGAPSRELFAPRAPTRAVAAQSPDAAPAAPVGLLATPSVPGTRRVAVPAGVIAAPAPPLAAAPIGSPAPETPVGGTTDGDRVPGGAGAPKTEVTGAPGSAPFAAPIVAAAAVSGPPGTEQPGAGESDQAAETTPSAGEAAIELMPAAGSGEPAREQQADGDRPGEQQPDRPPLPAIAPSTAAASAPRPAIAPSTAAASAPAPAGEEPPAAQPPAIAPSTAVGSAQPAREREQQDADAVRATPVVAPDAVAPPEGEEPPAELAAPAIAPSTAAASAARSGGVAPASPADVDDPFSRPPQAPAAATQPPAELDHDEPLPSGSRAPAVGLASTPAPSRVFDFDAHADPGHNGPPREQDAARRVPIPTRPSFPPPPQPAGGDSTVRSAPGAQERTVRGARGSAGESRAPRSLRARAAQLRGGALSAVPAWKLVAGAVLTVVLIVLAVQLLGGGSSTPVAHNTTPKSSTTTGAPATTAPAHSSVTVAVLNGTSTSHLAATIAKQLASSGYVKGSVGNAPSQTHSTTIVAYTAGGRAAAVEVAHSLGLTSASVAPADSATRSAASAAGGIAQVIVTVGANLVQ